VELSLCALLLTASGAGVLTGHGATLREWTGSASGFWSNPNNWDPVGVPEEGDTLFFLVGSNTSMINDLPDLKLTGLTFDSHNYTLAGNPLTVGVRRVFRSDWFTRGASTPSRSPSTAP